MRCSNEAEPVSGMVNLVTIVQSDYPEATEILVSFPGEWELIQKMSQEEKKLYLAAMPAEQVRPHRNQFFGLSPEITLKLTRYRLYRFFRPWPMPGTLVAWDKAVGKGQVVGEGDLKIQLQQLGQAQAWYGQRTGVIWECFLNEMGKQGGWLGEMEAIWGTVERNIGTAKNFTPPRDPAWGEAYPDFLRDLGYAPDTENSGWWSKERGREG